MAFQVVNTVSTTEDLTIDENKRPLDNLNIEYSSKRSKATEPSDIDSKSSQESDEKNILDQINEGELDEVVNDYENNTDSHLSGNSKECIPEEPRHPIILIKDSESGKYTLPPIVREDSLNARSFLKYYGSARFLDVYLPEDLNSLYIYQLIKLLGFQIKDKELLFGVQQVVTNSIYCDFNFKQMTASSKEKAPTHISAESTDDDVLYEDPLKKKHAVRLIKDLQKAMNKVLSTRIRLKNFHTIDDLTRKLKLARKVLVLTGAGISTSLGIPDFRSSQGFYSKLNDLGLDDPQDVFNLDIFMEDPSVFYNIAHMVLPPENIYSPLHSFIKLLQDKGKLLRNYTQNIDNLESYAGIESDKMVQCHGSFATASCVTCHWKLPGEKIFNNIRNMELPLCPYCYQKRKEQFPTRTDDELASSDQLNNQHQKVPYLGFNKSCGVLKPDITFFGEALPSKFHKFICEDVPQCDLLICIGTSLKVAPVSEIVNMIPACVPQVLINKDPVKHAEFDLTLLGLCDDVATLIAQKCQWDIPHDKWLTLKDRTFQCIEKEPGVYEVSFTNVSESI